MYIIISLCLWSLNGVSGENAVLEGESVTLNPDLTETQRNNQIEWRFGPNNILIAKLKDGEITVQGHYAGGRFIDRLKLDQTGSLTIMNTRTNDSGQYTVTRSSTALKSFNLIVYARLPVPVISSNNSQNSSSTSLSSASKCVFVCSVVNVSHVTLSWLKGNSLFSRISVSDLNNSISLHLECLDDSYSCVANNPISNQSTHLNTELCQPCAEDHVCCCSTEAVIRLVLSALVGLATVAVLVYDIRSQSLQQKRREQTSPSNS